MGSEEKQKKKVAFFTVEDLIKQKAISSKGNW